MKLVRLILFCVILFVAGGGLILFGRTLYPVIGEDAVRRARDAEVLVTGSSHARAIHAHVFSKRGIDLAYHGADGYEMAYLAGYGLSRLNNLRLAVLVVSPFTFIQDHGLYDRGAGSGLSQRRVEIYGQYPMWCMMPSDYSNFVAGRLYPLVTHDHWARFLYGYKPPELPPALTEKDALDQRGRMRASELNAQYRKMVGLHDGSLAHDISRSLEERIIDFQKNGVFVVLLTPPFWRAYVESLVPEMVKENDNAASELSRKTGAPYLSYMGDPRFIDDPELYWDADHLGVGATRFYEILRQDLKEVVPYL